MNTYAIRYVLFDLAAIQSGLILSLLIFHPKDPLAGLRAESPWIFLFEPAAIFTVFLTARVYRVLWEYMGVEDFLRLFLYSALSFAFLYGALWISGVTPALPFLSTVFFLTLLLMFLLRLLHRRESLAHTDQDRLAAGRVLILGAGEAGRNILLDYKKTGMLHQVAGLLDDDPGKTGMTIYGVKVLGVIDQVREFSESLDVSDIVLAIESISTEKISHLMESIDLKRVRIRIVPAQRESLLETIAINQTREIKAEDLLGRSPTELNDDLIKEALRGQCVFITGAGGSIGSEICHQLLSYPIQKLVCLSRSEFSLYKLQEKLDPENTEKREIHYFLGDVRDRDRLREIMGRFKPQIVFHAAAHKHVPYMEQHENEAIKNNVFGTENVLEVSREFGVKRFILISTDKAVRPTNVMGASKRLAELLTCHYGQKYGMHTALVRFGNVLGSRGSVVPIFRRQILKGGPITVTHPEVVRYFMTITEAALLVINCGAMSHGGERFVLDMGAPVKIDDLVRKMIRLYRYEPDKDIEIRYTGLRPGEKLHEELLTATENIRDTPNKKIFVLEDDHPIDPGFESWLFGLHQKLPGLSGKEIRAEIKKMVPEYQSLS